MYFLTTVPVSHGLVCFGIIVFQDLILIPNYFFRESNVFYFVMQLLSDK